MTTIAQIKTETQQKMQRSLEALSNEFKNIRTGRANPAIMERVQVEYYGAMMPLTQVCNVGLADARTISVQPYERSMIKAVEKAIRASDLGFNPAASGETIRVPVPPLTEERRRELTKVVHSAAEGVKVAVRNLRRDANDAVKALEKAKEVSEDDEKRAQKDIQKMTDDCIAKIDQATETKVKEVMTV